MNDDDKIVKYAILVILIAIIAIEVAVLLDPFVFPEIRNKDTCYKTGYPDYRYSNGQVYCIKRVNGTDIVIPANEVKQ